MFYITNLTSTLSYPVFSWSKYLNNQNQDWYFAFNDSENVCDKSHESFEADCVLDIEINIQTNGALLKSN